MSFIPKIGEQYIYIFSGCWQILLDNASFIYVNITFYL